MLGYWGMSCRSLAVTLRHHISTVVKQIFIAKQWFWSWMCLAWTHWRYPLCCMVCAGVFESQFSCRWKCSCSISFCDDARTHPSVVQVGTKPFMEMSTVCYQLYPVLHEFSYSLNGTCGLMCFNLFASFSCVELGTSWNFLDAWYFLHRYECARVREREIHTESQSEHNTVVFRLWFRFTH